MSALESARKKLADASFAFDDLPATRDDPLWNRIEQQLLLSLSEVSSLKNARCLVTQGVLAFHPVFKKRPLTDDVKQAVQDGVARVVSVINPFESPVSSSGVLFGEDFVTISQLQSRLQDQTDAISKKIAAHAFIQSQLGALPKQGTESICIVCQDKHSSIVQCSTMHPSRGENEKQCGTYVCHRCFPGMFAQLKREPNGGSGWGYTCPICKELMFTYPLPSSRRNSVSQDN